VIVEPTYMVTAEHAGALWARRLIDLQLNDGPEPARQ